MFIPPRNENFISVIPGVLPLSTSSQERVISPGLPYKVWSIWEGALALHLHQSPWSCSLFKPAWSLEGGNCLLGALLGKESFARAGTPRAWNTTSLEHHKGILLWFCPNP